MPMIAESSPAAVSRKLSESPGTKPDILAESSPGRIGFSDFMIPASDAQAVFDKVVSQDQAAPGGEPTADTEEDAAAPTVTPQEELTAVAFSAPTSPPTTGTPFWTSGGSPQDAQAIEMTSAPALHPLDIRRSDPVRADVPASLQGASLSQSTPGTPGFSSGPLDGTRLAASPGPSPLGKGKASPARADSLVPSAQASNQDSIRSVETGPTPAQGSPGLPAMPLNGPSKPALQTQAQSDTVESIFLAEGIGPSSLETRGAQSTTGLTLTHNAPRAPSAPVLSQIVDAIRMTSDGSIDIALSPEELGRVRLVLQASDTGLQVNIQSERSETLDLLRRHIDQLHEDLSAAGFADVNFSFGRSSRQSSSDPLEDAASTGVIPAQEDPEIPALATLQSSGDFTDLRLNLRL